MRNLERRKERSREAARTRRSRESDIFDELLACIPRRELEQSHARAVGDSEDTRDDSAEDAERGACDEAPADDATSDCGSLNSSARSKQNGAAAAATAADLGHRIDRSSLIRLAVSFVRARDIARRALGGQAEARIDWFCGRGPASGLWRSLADMFRVNLTCNGRLQLPSIDSDFPPLSDSSSATESDGSDPDSAKKSSPQHGSPVDEATTVSPLDIIEETLDGFVLIAAPTGATTGRIEGLGDAGDNASACEYENVSRDAPAGWPLSKFGLLEVVYASTGIMDTLGIPQSDALGSDLLSLIHPWDVDEMCDWLAEAHEMLADGMQRGGSRVCASMPAKLLRFRSLQSNRRTVHKSFSFKLANCVAKLVELAPREVEGASSAGDEVARSGNFVLVLVASAVRKTMLKPFLPALLSSTSATAGAASAVAGVGVRRSSSIASLVNGAPESLADTALPAEAMPGPYGVGRCVSRHALDMKFSFLDDRLRELLLVSDGAARIEGLVGQSFFSCVHPDDLDTLMQQFASLYKKEHMVTGTYRLLARGVTELYVQTEAMLLFENGSGLCAGSSNGGKHGKKPVGILCVHSLVSSPPEAPDRNAALAEDEERAPLLSDFQRRQFRNSSSFRIDESFRASAGRGASGRFLGDANESGLPLPESLARRQLSRQQAPPVAAKEAPVVQNVPHERFVSAQMAAQEKMLPRQNADVWSMPSAESDPKRAMGQQAPANEASMGEFMSALTRNSSGASIPGKDSATNSNASLLSFLDMENLFLPSSLDSARLPDPNLFSDLFADPNLLQGFMQASASGPAAPHAPLAGSASSTDSLGPHAPAPPLGGIGGAHIDNELRDQLARVAREELIDLTESDFTVTTPAAPVSAQTSVAQPQPTYSAPPPLATPPSTPVSMQTSQAIIDGLSVATLLVDQKGTSSILDDLIKDFELNTLTYLAPMVHDTDVAVIPSELESIIPGYPRSDPIVSVASRVAPADSSSPNATSSTMYEQTVGPVDGPFLNSQQLLASYSSAPHSDIWKFAVEAPTYSGAVPKVKQEPLVQQAAHPAGCSGLLAADACCPSQESGWPTMVSARNLFVERALMPPPAPPPPRADESPRAQLYRQRSAEPPPLAGVQTNCSTAMERHGVRIEIRSRADSLAPTTPHKRTACEAFERIPSSEALLLQQKTRQRLDETLFLDPGFVMPQLPPPGFAPPSAAMRNAVPTHRLF